MKIAITGANSAVGRAILSSAPEQNGLRYELVGVVRSDRAAEKIRGLLSEGSTAVAVSYGDSASLDAALQGASAVVHLPGILFERPGSTFEQANVETTSAVVEAAKRCGVEKIVLVSATGANETASNRYWRTKGQAESLVRNSGLPYTILRVPLLLGPGTEGSAALARNAASPTAKLIDGGRNIQQPLHVGDLARAAMIATRPSIARNQTLELVGPVSLPDREIVERAARLLGHEVRIRSIHKGLLSFGLSIRQLFSKPAFSRDVLEVITADTRIDHRGPASELGISLKGIDEMIKDSLGPGSTR